VLFVFSLFSAQLLRLQALDASPVASAALKSRLYVGAVPAMRGDITDANGVVLATSIERRNVTADQTAVPEYKKKVNGVRQTVGVLGAAADLAPILGKSELELSATLTGDRQFVYVAKDVTPLSWRKVLALGIPGIFSEPTSSRSYPNSSAAASLVGWVGGDGTAGGGLELLMRHQAGRKAGQVDLRTVPGRADHPDR